MRMASVNEDADGLVAAVLPAASWTSVMGGGGASDGSGYASAAADSEIAIDFQSGDPTASGSRSSAKPVWG